MTKRKRPKNGRKRRMRKRRTVKKLLTLLCVLAVLTFIISLVYTVFQVKAIDVTGNKHVKSEEIVGWIQEEKFSDNTLYIWVKYNLDSTKQLPSVESVDVKLKSPWVVEVQVHEKELIGRIDCGNEFLYFDINGTACYKTSEVWEGIPYVEGVKIKSEEVELGSKIPVEKEALFEQISELSKNLIELDLRPDRVIYEKEGITICFEDIRVMIGTSGFEEKLEQIPPILKKLSEEYSGKTGVLHLENYEAGEKTIRFVPDDDTSEDDTDEESIPDDNEANETFSDDVTAEESETYESEISLTDENIAGDEIADENLYEEEIVEE